MVENIVKLQRKFYSSGKTRSYEFRAKALQCLKEAIKKNESLLLDALLQDLNKSHYESYLCEIGIVLDEIRFHQKHLRKWMKVKPAKTAIGQLPGRCYLSSEPYGNTLIMSPWNYPVNLCFEPLIGAISGGNTAIIKPSEYAPATSAAVAKIIADAFPPKYITVIEGGIEENTALLHEKFDYIFFTGSTEVGKIVMTAAAQNLTPVTLELGGKSPVIVDQTANLKLAARRIAFGKVTNAGQTCVAPDYLLIHESVKDQFLQEYKLALKQFFPGGDMSQMAKIISEKHYNRLKSLIQNEHIVIGGGTWDDRHFIEPTVLDEVGLNSPIMKEEIFGPILPIITYRDIKECIALVQSTPKPLAFYLFTRSNHTKQFILQHCSFGGGCINDTILHLASPHLPFGGVGASGMGSYHGKKSFETFTHYRSIFEQSNTVDIPLRYMPYSKAKLSILRKILN